MGERRSDDGLFGRRRVHPGGTVSEPRPEGGTPGFESLFAAVVRVEGTDTEAEQRAVAAFRAARDSGAHRARTRRRDDWRPRRPRSARLSAKVTLSVLLASLTLGGVAVAAIGSAGSAPDHDGGTRPSARASTSAAQQSAPAAESTAPGTSSARPHHPATAQDTVAHCRAYEQIQSRGKALDATAWQRLVTAAGGEKNVAAYCAEQMAHAGGDTNGNKGDKPRNSPSSGGNSGNSGNGGSSGNSGNGRNGKTGNVVADSGKSSGKK